MTSSTSHMRSPVSPASCSTEASPPRGVTFDDLVALAQDEERAGHREAARGAYEQALYCARTADDAAKLSNVVRWIARTHQVDGNAEAARDCLEAALAIAEAWNDGASAGHAINLQAIVSWQRGELDDAERLYLLARSRAIHAGDAKLAAMTAQNLGVLANIRGNFELAERQYTTSLSEYRSLGLTTDVCVALNNLGLLYIAQQRWDDAERVLLEGVQICELSGDPMTRTQLDINLAELWVRRGEYVRAQSAVRKALDAATQTGDASAIGKATKLLGVIARETGSFEDADRHFQRADEVATARGELLLQAEVARERADLARRMGKNREVLQQLNRSHRLFTILRAQPDLTDVDERVSDLEQEFLHVARRWGESIEAKDRYTQGHCQRVAELACAIAQLSGLDEHSMFWFRIGALLHDVGKLVIPEEVLNKPGKLDDTEWQLMRSHTTAGVEMLADIEFPWDVRPMVESHHERWDGRGYPHGLAGENIPLIARILTIADVYDALTSVRSYKRAHSHEETMDILRKDIGTMFDPTVFAWFEAVAPEWPTKIAHLMNDVVATSESSDALTPADGVVRDATSNGELDDLTGVPMRRAFRETAEQMLDARRTSGRPVSLLVIDIDHFKTVNDMFGHLQGDAALRLVTQQIRANMRPTDYVARYAGDEFVVLLPGTRLEDACIVAERVREAVANATIGMTDGSAELLRVTLSIGAACAPLHGETMEALFGAADNALYAAKRSGRNAVNSAARIGTGKNEVLLDCFVARSTERTRLRKLLGNANIGEPHVAVVRGEAGIGKSALLKQLSPDIAIRGGAILVGHCIEANVGIPYGPWADLVRAAHRAGLVRAKRWRELSRLVPELQRDIESVDGASRPLSAPNSGSQRVLLEELEEFLQLASTTKPLVLVLDDIQWADPATWDALEFLLARLREHRILICLTVRPEDSGAASESRLRRLSRSERCSDLTLQRLRRDELAQWLRTTLGGQAPAPALLEYVLRQSEGNPFFAVQTLRALVEDGALRNDGESWQFALASDAPVPRAIGDLLARRIERLSHIRRNILSLAAIIGREFDPEVLVAVYTGEESDVHDALDAGLATAVLMPCESERSMLTFTHALLTRTILRGINPLRQRLMHLQVARALDVRPIRDAAAIAMHFDYAGVVPEAYRSSLDAGQQAQSVYAYESAAAFFRMARRHATTPTEIASVEWQIAHVEDAGGHAAAAEVHCNLVLSTHAQGATTLGILPAARRMRERLRFQRGVSADDVYTACSALLIDAQRDNNAEEVIALLIMLSTAQQRIGNVAAAETLARDAVNAVAKTAQSSLHADAAMRLGSVLLTASPANAVPQYRRALDLFTRLGDRDGQLRCQINIGSAYDRAGDHDGAEASYLTALEIGREIRAGDFTGVAALNLGVLLLKSGHLVTARARFDESLALFVVSGHEPYRLASLYNLAHVARAEGEAARALELYGTCVVLAKQIAQSDVHIGALAGAGLSELDLDAPVNARTYFAAAQALLTDRADWWFQGRELWETLAIRLTARDSDAEVALSTLLSALARVETHDQYAALWLGAACADLLVPWHASARVMRERLHKQARALGYAPLVQLLSTSAVSTALLVM